VEGEYVGLAVLDGCGREDAVILEEGLDVFGIRDLEEGYADCSCHFAGLEFFACAAFEVRRWWGC